MGLIMLIMPSQQLFSLKGKKVIITGGAGFFGRYFCRAVLNHGADKLVVIEYPGKGDDFKKELVKKYGKNRVSWYPVDLYDREATDVCYKKIAKAEKKIDVLVNNAFDFSLKTGFNHPSGKLENATFGQIEASFKSGIYWAIQSTQFFGKLMKKAGKGSIINICSMYANVVPSPHLYKGTEKFNPPGYSMAKAGLFQFTKYAASFFGPEVRANTMSPGAIPNLESKTYNAVNAASPEEKEFLQRLVDRTLLNRVGHPSDLIGTLIFLASDASSYITGVNIPVDGGWTVI